MTHRFAHMADIHLGANRDPSMEKLEVETFSKAMETCIRKEVDFILICGDLFHVGIPDLGVVRQAVTKIREVRDRGIRIYAIYGSHDYTPTGTSVIDILESAGILENISKGREEEGKLRLKFTVDEKTGAKLAGIAARKIGLERRHYEILDREGLEHVEGFKILAFHSGLDEFKPDYLDQMKTIPISYFPKGFDYYAGGHIHERSENALPGYEKIVFPGPLFTGYARDLEATAKGERRGFYIVNFAKKIESLEFVEIRSVDSTYFGYDTAGKNSVQACNELKKNLAEIDVRGKMVVLKVRGELSGGRTSELDFPGLREMLLQNGAVHVHLNRFGLKSKEYSTIRVIGEDLATIETRTFSERIRGVKVNVASLQGDSGVAASRELLRVVRNGPKINESKRNYEGRMISNGIEILALIELMKT